MLEYLPMSMPTREELLWRFGKAEDPEIEARRQRILVRGLRRNALVHDALGFAMQHPWLRAAQRARLPLGAVPAFVIELREQYADMTASKVAEVLGLPLSTLNDWMRDARHAPHRARGCRAEPR